jgi:hypothetical protein
MQSAHNDIGYTHPREQIMRMYLDHYDRVLDLCRATAAAPEEQRFKWTCEVAWQVQHYLQARPERLAEFVHYAQTGRIELTAAYLHFTDLIDADLYDRSLQWAVDFAAAHHLPLRSAIHSDINGWPWAVADLLAARQIPFFCSHVHIDSATDPLGQRGSAQYLWLIDMPAEFRADVPFRIPQAFWWEGPRGGRVLHWLGEHYLLGNVLGLSSFTPFHAEKTRYFTATDHLTVDDMYARAQEEVPRYISRLREAGYPHAALLLSTGGFYTDNSAPDDRWCGVVERWNREHDDIRLRTATVGDWYEWLLAHAGDLPVRRVAWPDHWAHGLGSATARIAQERQTQRRRAGVRALAAMAASEPCRQLLSSALDQEQMALEHTFNAFCSESRPGATVNAYETAAKELTFHRAAYDLDEAAQTALRSVHQPVTDPVLYLYHTGDDGAYSVQFGPGDQRLDPAAQCLVDAAGARYRFQQDNAPGMDPGYVSVLPLAGQGLHAFRLVAEAGLVERKANQGRDSLTLASQWWELGVDPERGGLARLVDRATGQQWVDNANRWAFGQLVHERVVHPAGRQAVGNLARWIALDMASEQARRRLAPGPIVTHLTPTPLGEPRREHGPVYDSIALGGDLGSLGPVCATWRVYHAMPLVELLIDWRKEWCPQPEAAYVAFPFAAAGGDLLLETGGGIFRPGSHAAGGQLPGTCSSYYTVQRGAYLAAAGGALAWLPVDAPLVMPNRIDYNNWETGEWQWNGFLASMPVNHYWHTNFPMSQRGPLVLRYRIVPALGAADSALQAGTPLHAIGWL